MAKELSKIEFTRFQTLIYQMSGIQVPDKKLVLLGNRIRKRLKVLGCSDFATYLKRLRTDDGDEMKALLDLVTTNETSFFRTPKHFDWLRNDFITGCVLDARKGKREKKIRIWSAACSTGEEPYSIAICLLENQLRLKDWSLKVVGTDLSQAVIEAAIAGGYKEDACGGLDDKRRKRFFEFHSAESKYHAKSTLKSLVDFQIHNLIQPWPGESFDCIFLRNVMIYFDRESKRMAIDNIARALKPGGFLVVGPSEGIFDMLDGLEKVSIFLYRKAHSP